MKKIYRVLAFLLVVAFLGQASAAAMGSPVAASVGGVPIMFEVVKAGSLKGIGRSIWMGTLCRVSIDETAVNAVNIAHEVAHCLDWGLQFSSRWGNAGCRIRQYACDPAEGFADAFALAYVMRHGNDLKPLGWYGDPSKDLPDPAEITPEWLEEFFRG